MPQRKRGSYLGTEVDGRWWRRRRRDALFARGAGRYWYDEDSFCFRRYLTRKPIRIRFSDISSVATGGWHSGKWPAGATVPPAAGLSVRPRG